MPETGYENIEKLTNQQNNMLDNALEQQKNIINKQTELNVAGLEKNKAEIDQQTNKTNQGLYAQYKKASNPYGVNAEQLYTKGLGNSGYAETTQTNLYNTYQKNITETINNAQKLKSDFDFQISQARQTGDITLAQSALEIYNQKMQLLSQEYELRNNREQFLYQQEQNKLAQSNWEKEYAYQQQRDQIADNQWQQTFDYQKQRDTVADNQWAKQYALSQKKSSSSSRIVNPTVDIPSEYIVQENQEQNNNNDIQEAKSEENVFKKAFDFVPQSSIYTAFKKGYITEEEAEKLYNKLGV
ncbi:MAG: hypothetical protein HFJ49_04415 [Clostridia bacterium]|jgi:hypothetical protein|nr:hypothetical protein [Clostridia bacterium]